MYTTESVTAINIAQWGQQTKAHQQTCSCLDFEAWHHNNLDNFFSQTGTSCCNLSLTHLSWLGIRSDSSLLLRLPPSGLVKNYVGTFKTWLHLKSQCHVPTVRLHPTRALERSQEQAKVWKSHEYTNFSQFGRALVVPPISDLASSKQHRPTTLPVLSASKRHWPTVMC
jgi:hypothetical protein